MMGLSSTAVAQEKSEKVENVFNPHWYIQVQPLGAQYTLGEDSFGDLSSYNLQVAGGYNFNKLIGARLAVNAFQSKAGWEMNGQSKTWKWNYVAPTVDVTLNLSNLLFGYNPDRFFTLSAFAGAGAPCRQRCPVGCLLPRPGVAGADLEQLLSWHTTGG